MYGACVGSVVMAAIGQRTPTEEQRKAAIEHIRSTGEFESLDDLLKQADAYARSIAAAESDGNNAPVQCMAAEITGQAGNGA